MAYTIRDRNGNLYEDRPNGKSTVYMSLKCVSKALVRLPVGYFIRDETTKKRVIPNE